MYAVSDPMIKIGMLLNGPTITRVRADTAYWQYYRDGILNNSCCYGKGFTNPLNHAVQTCGWGIETIEGVETAYWLIRNSWGTTYGGDQPDPFKGYIKLKIATTGPGMCGEQISFWNYTMTTL